MVYQNLTNDSRHKIACLILSNAPNYKPNRGIFKDLAAEYGVDRRTINRLWKTAKEQRQSGIPLSLNSKIAGKKGREPIPVLVEQILATKRDDRTTLRRLSTAIGVSRCTVHNWVKTGKIKAHTTAMHPKLIEENKEAQLQWALWKLFWDREPKKIKFKTMDYTLHMDEKWFYMCLETYRYYVLEDEEDAYRSCQSKRYITKVMFMAIVGRHIYSESGEIFFDGKVGIFHFSCQEAAKRRSKNRPRGTLETKLIPVVNKEVTRQMVINQIIPAIKAKWPSLISKNIILQQDNAKPDINTNDPEFVHAATLDGFSISLPNQPPDSPDMNVLDLGFFRAIQSLQWSKGAKSVDELLGKVQNAWDEQPVNTLDDVWLSLQNCSIEVMKRKGHNDYKLPHMKKQAQRREDTLPRDLTVDVNLVKECIQCLRLAGNTTNFNDLLPIIVIEDELIAMEDLLGLEEDIRMEELIGLEELLRMEEDM